ncbi:uncharacterized protein LOC134821808 [Bolinopsis microptera]|uniref:uncharacterized protein LOC134821808 n=1 Tax=Bolinopsis microptera TaxID=2820187 RepID=UPI00307A5E18
MSMFTTLFIATAYLSLRLVVGIRLSEYPPEFLILPQDSELTLTCRVEASSTNPSTAPDASSTFQDSTATNLSELDLGSVGIQWFYQQTADGQEWFLFESEVLEYSSVQTSYEGFYFCKAVLNDEELVRSNVTRLKIACK